MVLICFVMIFLALEALCLAMDRHARQLAEASLTPSARRLSRYAGWLLLGLSVWPAITMWGLSIGISVWFGLLTVASILLALALSYRPRWIGASLIAGLFARRLPATGGKER